jgi:hypothetical protein
MLMYKAYMQTYIRFVLKSLKWTINNTLSINVSIAYFKTEISMFYDECVKIPNKAHKGPRNHPIPG